MNYFGMSEKNMLVQGILSLLGGSRRDFYVFLIIQVINLDQQKSQEDCHQSITGLS